MGGVGAAAPVAYVRDLGQQDYAPTWQAMGHFTDTRNGQTHDEFWLVEHPPVFTLGQAR